MISRHTRTLVDFRRIKQMLDLCFNRRLLSDCKVVEADDNSLWAVIPRLEYSFGIPLLGPGRFFDGLAREHWKSEYEQRLDHITNLNIQAKRQELSILLQQLSFGQLAFRVYWTVHAEFIRQQNSKVVIPLTYLRRAVWGETFPNHWRSVLRSTLNSLAYIHILEQNEGSRENFSDSTSLLTHFNIPKRSNGLKCPSQCVLHGQLEHEHASVVVGRGMCGDLEGLAVDSEQDGSRSYRLPRQTQEKRERDEANRCLREIGKKGNVTTLFLPSVLGSRSHGKKLSVKQQYLFQVIFREGTRSKSKKQGAVSQMGIVKGNFVRSPSQAARAMPKTTVACPFLNAMTDYVGFNGNGVRNGLGYKVNTWARRADYEQIEKLFSDLCILEEKLGFIVVGVQPATCEWYDLARLRARASISNHSVSNLHLRVFAQANYEELWIDYFGWQRNIQVDDVGAVEEIRSIVHSSSCKQNIWAARLGLDPSLFSKILRGKRRIPNDLPERMRQIAQASGNAV